MEQLDNHYLCNVIIFFLGMIFSVVGTDALAGNAELSVTAPVVTASCDISIPQSVNEIPLGTFIASDFSENKGTASVRNFQVKIDNCSGEAGTMHPALKVQGGHLDNNPYVFSSQASNPIGFLIRAEKFSGSLADFYNTNARTTVKDDAFSYDNDVHLIKGGVMDYTVGLVAPGLAPGGDGTAPATGDVKASVTFEFIYH
ncbi:fimbrial protein [Klebsiella aerogenes]|nr:type 1 fimbrial protein [Klebsiella aerogenes]